MFTAVAALIPTLGSIVPFALRRAGHSACALGAAAVTLSSLLFLILAATALPESGHSGFRIDWIPQLNLSLSFFLDGLGLFFASLILGMGLLVILYARHYLSDSEPVGWFYFCLLMFQGAMLGIVLSDNILLLLVFWELTSLSSFLLIGYWNHRADSREGARMALFVTGGGGLALIAGMLLLGSIAGSYELTEILDRGEQVRASPLAPLALALILLGAFAKSAQFPFHFWLPNAMAAPTPVSAYLHSATMVKAGIFLLARLWPVFAPMEMWVSIVSVTGLVTMVLGAAIALFKDDLKQLLAYSTVSHLGLIVMLLGMGTQAALVAAMFHVLNHALFKAALFMSAGIIDHETGTRSMRRLGGLARLMPITAGLATVAAASMAGVPLLNGFLSKEMMLEQAAMTPFMGIPGLFAILATLGALLSVAYSARMVLETFHGQTAHPASHHPHDPPKGMWLPVALLIIPVVAIGLLPWLAEPIVRSTVTAIARQPFTDLHFKLWHGWTPALAMSVLAFAGGTHLVRNYSKIDDGRSGLWRPDARRLFEAAIAGLATGASRLVDAVDPRDLARYVGITVSAVVLLGAVTFFGAPHIAGDRPALPPTAAAMVAWGVLIAASLLAVGREGDRFLLIVMTSTVGLIVSLAFLQFSAPDLALTQISIEIVTTILMLLALNLMPKTAVPEGSAGQRWINGTVATFAGIGTAALAFMVLRRGYSSISDYHLAESKPSGGGTNVVNVILVDFRGFDTLGEIMVLGIAGLAIYAMLDSALAGRARRRLAQINPTVKEGDPHSLILESGTRILLPFVLTVGAYIFVRGHNEPGGGFIAGIIVAIGFIMQYVASGYRWSHERAKLDPQLMIGVGILTAALSGVGSWVLGYPYLTSSFGYFNIPLLGQLELASVIVFDLGVFLTVVGTVLIALANLSRVEEPPGPLVNEPQFADGAFAVPGTTSPAPSVRSAPQESN